MRVVIKPRIPRVFERAQPAAHQVLLLQQQDISRLDVVNYLSHGIAKHGGEDSSPQQDEGEGRQSDGGEGDIKGVVTYNETQVYKD